VSRLPGRQRQFGTVPPLHDLAVIVVSTNEANWLGPCLSTLFAHAGGLDLDVVVVDNDSTDGTTELVAREFPRARVVGSTNHGFGHANNRALMTCDARYVLFLNPDTEIKEGSFADLIALLDSRPEIGLASVKQLLGDGTLYPTIRRFPSARTAIADALGAERLKAGPKWLGERQRDPAAYERETRCDWVTGAFMVARREALESAGYLDERFFMSSEETDLCRRIKAAGWEVFHLPDITIVHHAGKIGVNPKLDTQFAFSRRLYANKHFSPAHRLAYLAALVLWFGLRMLYPGSNPDLKADRRTSARRSMGAVIGREGPPYEPPPQTALRTREQSPPRTTTGDAADATSPERQGAIPPPG
jgi:N-acetylglucosaminyl-diphospho-decaprenol L-rhamnosyltransferase